MVRCGIKHGFGDATCIRENGHDGLCWSRAYRVSANGTIHRAEWYSKDGKFKSHYQYVTKCPTNAQKGTA